MFGGIWRFLKDPVNFAVIAAIAGGAWALFVHFYPTPEAKPSPVQNKIEADCGSVAIGGDVSGTTITAGSGGDCPKSGR
jgi:hypothetical protein